MADMSIILVYCFLYMAITLINCDELTLRGIPTVTYGSRQKLKCSKSGPWRIGDVTFYRDGKEFAVVGREWFKCVLQAHQDENNLDKECSWRTRTLIINKVDNKYNNTEWRCKRGGTSKKFIMEVEDLTPCSFNASISGNVSNVVEGDDLHLTCDSDSAADNDLTYSWTIYYNNGSSSTFEKKTIDNTVSRGDTGIYSCQIKKGKDCTSEAQIDIKVQYHPTVSIYSESNSTINMTCIGDGYPDNFTFYGWHHYINDQLVRVLRGNETRGSTILILERVTVLDNGKYRCLLSNGIPDKDRDLNSSAEYTVKLLAAPIAIENKVKEININTEDNVNMTSVFLTEDVKSVTLIAPSDTQKGLNASDIVQEEYRDINVYGTTVNVSVSVVQYSIQNVINEGQYYFNVCNVHGLCNVSYGYSIHFNSKEPQSGMNDTEEPGHNLPIIIGAVAAVAVVMVIVIIVIVVVRRRSSTSKLNNYDQHDNSRSNPIYDDRNVEIIPNELYQSSDPTDNNTQMEIIPNNLYVSSDPKPDTNLKNMEILPNELYVSADAENQSRDQDTNGLKKATPDELYVGGETIAKNKEIQRQIKSSYADNDQVYVNDSMMQ